MANPQLTKAIDECISQYLQNIDNNPHNLYDLIMQEVESALIKNILARNDNNRSLTANHLGIARNTLIKKIRQYQI